MLHTTLLVRIALAMGGAVRVRKGYHSLSASVGLQARSVVLELRLSHPRLSPDGMLGETGK